MKKGTLKLIAVLIVALLFVPFSAVSAGSNAPFKCGLDITYDDWDVPDEYYWSGFLSDCELEGTISFYAVPDEYAFAGKTMHFVETFIIEPDIGGEIKGKNWGVWNMSTFKFRANGWVMDASPQWEYLVGAKYHEMGTTSPPPPEPGPIYAPGGTAKLVPANRQPHALP